MDINASGQTLNGRLEIVDDNPLVLFDLLQCAFDCPGVRWVYFEVFIHRKYLQNQSQRVEKTSLLAKIVQN